MDADSLAVAVAVDQPEDDELAQVNRNRRSYSVEDRRRPSKQMGDRKVSFNNSFSDRDRKISVSKHLSSPDLKQNEDLRHKFSPFGSFRFADKMPRTVRSVSIGDSSDTRSAYRFANNAVTTSRYNVLNFIPKTVFEQFRRVANLYFLAQAILMVAAEQTNFFETPYASYTVTVSLSAVIAMTMIKELLEDLKRHRSDKQTNHRKATVLDRERKEWVQTEWRNLEVGNIVQVQSGETMPADLVLLSSSEPDGGAFVETSNIDGETNLKIRESQPILHSGCGGDVASLPGAIDASKRGRARELSTMTGVMTFPVPSKDIHSFDANIAIYTEKGKEIVPLSPKQLFLRGSELRNTVVAWCVVVYTGKETKVMMNSRSVPSKLSNLERTINRCIWIIFAAQTILCMLASLAAVSADPSFVAYLEKELKVDIVSNRGVLQYFLSFIVLFNNFLPISLYITVEMVLYGQAYFMEHDIEMYDAESDTPAKVRTSNLNGDFGQVDYIFSDKTGTLTQNVMKLKRCSVGGKSYGGKHAVYDKQAVCPEGTEFRDDRFMSDLRGVSNHAKKLDDFCRCLALCHTVVVEHDTNTSKKIYQAESPDEGALVHGASAFGYTLDDRTARTITVQTPTGLCNYEVLAVNEFSSARKRMSILVRTPERKTILYCKGADNVMMDLLAERSDSKRIVTMKDHLKKFACDGLRTLVLAKRVISSVEATNWLRKWEKAKADVDSRDHKLQVVADEIETKLSLVGATAIEDKLQDGVPDTIHRLSRAGIKIWVLTGDKEETAINIGLSCKLLSSDMDIIKIDKDTSEELLVQMDDLLKALGALADPQGLFRRMLQHTAKAGAAFAELFSGARKENIEDAQAENLALVVHGNTALVKILNDEKMSQKFLKLCKLCKAVVACRVSPSQKANIVRMVKEGITPSPVTLSIGDGANDVPMIQEAHLGVGISGKEGKQAVNASDVAIAQFRFLQRLLLVHGRWNYRRLSTVVLYSFFKNIVLTATSLLFQFNAGWSGQSLYEENLYTGYNFFLGWPIVFVGVLDKDISARTALEVPMSYVSGRLNLDINPREMGLWVIGALSMGCVVYALPLYVLDGLDGNPSSWSVDGKMDGLVVLGTIVYSSLISSMNLKLAFVTHRWTIFNIIAVGVLSMLFYYGSMSWYSTQFFLDLRFFEFFDVFRKHSQRAVTWLSVLLILGAVTLIDISLDYCRTQSSGNDFDLLIEYSLGRRGIVPPTSKSENMALKRRADSESAEMLHVINEAYDGDQPSALTTETKGESSAILVARSLSTGSIAMTSADNSYLIGSEARSSRGHEKRHSADDVTKSRRKSSYISSNYISQEDLQLMTSRLSDAQRDRLGLISGALRQRTGFAFAHPEFDYGPGAANSSKIASSAVQRESTLGFTPELSRSSRSGSASSRRRSIA